MNWIERPSALERRKFSMIWGEKTTTQQAMEMEPQMPDIASTSRLRGAVGGAMVVARLVWCAQLLVCMADVVKMKDEN